MSKARKFIGKAKVIPQRNALLLPYQQKWVLDKSRLKIMEKGRQIGISWATAYSLVRRKAMRDAQLDAWVSSRDEIQARLFLEDCKAFSGILNAGAEDLGEQVFDDKGSSGFVLRMANGLRINSMSSSPDAQAGKRGDRVLDEFALHKDPRKLYSIAYPGITWGGQFEIVSTHRGKDNFFNEIVVEVKEKGNPKGFSLHTVTLPNALDQGFLYKLQSKLPLDDPRQEMDESEYFDFIRAGCADEDSFQQEYMCIPVDSDSIFMPYDLIVPCEYDSSEEWEIDLSKCKEGFYVGVDVGRKHDLTVVWVTELCGGRFMTRKLIELKNTKFSEQEKIIYPILALPNMRRACFDASGLGMQLAERAQEKFGNYRVEPVTFTAQTKEALAYPLKAAFEDRNVRIPFASEIRQDLRGIKKETTAAGNVRFCGDRGTNGHSDRFWALALSIHAASTADLGPCRMEPAMMPESSGSGNRNWMRPERNTEPESNWAY